MAKLAIDEIGNTYGRLTVIERAGTKYNKAAWKVQCTCGNTLIVQGSHLRSGNTTSCGCYHKESIGAIGKTRWIGHVKVTPKVRPSSGNPVGRPQTISREVKDQVAELVRAATPYRQICKMLPVTTGSVSNIIKEYGITPVPRKHRSNGPTKSPAAHTGTIDT